MSRGTIRRLKDTFAGLPLAVQLVLALAALIPGGVAAGLGVMWVGEYEETHGPFMPLLIGGAVLIASATAWFVWENGALERQHARFTLEDVQSAIENCLDLHGDDHDKWDLFLGLPIDDPYLESVRQRCGQIWDEQDSELVSPPLRRELEKILQELRRA